MHRPKFFSVFLDALVIVAIVNARKVCIANEELGNVRSVGFFIAVSRSAKSDRGEDSRCRYSKT